MRTSDNVRKPDTSHNLKYRHDDHYRGLNSKREALRAVMKAKALRKEVLLDSDDVENDHADNAGDVSISAVASYDASLRRWVVDTGCPIDLVASDDLSQSERKYIKDAGRH